MLYLVFKTLQLHGYFQFKDTDDNYDKTVFLPVNILRVVQNSKRIYTLDVDPDRVSNLDPRYVVSKVNELCDRLVVIRGQDNLQLSVFS